jgi:hypothetical protein
MTISINKMVFFLDLQNAKEEIKIQISKLGKKTKVEPVQQTKCTLILTTKQTLQEYFRKHFSIKPKFDITYRNNPKNRLQPLPDEVDTAERLKTFCDLFSIGTPPDIHIIIDVSIKESFILYTKILRKTFINSRSQMRSFPILEDIFLNVDIKFS